MIEQSPLISCLLSTPICASLGVARQELRNNQCSKVPVSDGMKHLRYAVSSGDSDNVHRLLKSLCTPLSDNEVDMPLICIAAGKGYADITGLLIRHGARVNAQSNEGSTALIYAADGGHLAVLSLLLNAGAALNVINFHGESALTRATRRGWVQCARLLLSYGANPNRLPSNGHNVFVSPLHIARQLYQPAIEQDILRRSIEIDKALVEIVSMTLPNHLTLVQPGHLPDTVSSSLFPVQLISPSEIDNFTVYFKTPPYYGARSTQSTDKESSQRSTPSDELIFVYIVRAQLFDNHVSCWLTGPTLEAVSLTFNGTSKHCTRIPLSSECSGMSVFSVSTVIRRGVFNTLCLELRAQNSSNAETIQDSLCDTFVLVGAYRICLDVQSLVRTSMNPVSTPAASRPTYYIPRPVI
ncbi:unnamed protein product [Trichobilharzia szidati]|nr:unnamed protein product [Trichobilharzia szidati]